MRRIKMEKNIKRKSDSVFVGAIVWTILFLVKGVYKLIYINYLDWTSFIIAAISFTVLIAILRKSKLNLNERYEDERKKYISEKSSSVACEVNIFIIILLYIASKFWNVIVNVEDMLLIILGSLLIVKFITYIILQKKY
jgi:uncharacterized membrane protein